MGIEIVKDVYVLTKAFPREEMYGLTSQMRRAAISIPANIAEGFKRFHTNEYRQFLHIAFGSIAELETHLEIAKELEFTSFDQQVAVSEKLESISKMMSSLLSKLKH